MMNDYKELVEQLDGACCFKMVDGDISKADLFARAADAIEQLVKERDAAVSDLWRNKTCGTCNNNKNIEICKECLRIDLLADKTFHKLWAWRGVKEDNDETY